MTVSMCRGIPFGWIGLYKYSESSTDPRPSAQYWLDGSTSTFRRWAVGNPDDTNTRCIGMWTALGAFDDRDCDDEYSVVCKKTGGVYVVNFTVLNIFSFTFAICCRPSVCRLSVVCSLSVCNVGAPYSGGSNFRQYFYGVT